jgi:hypothetical protein
VDGGESALPPNWAPQVTNCLVVDVPVDSPEWRKVCERFHTSLKQSLYHVIRVERIQVSPPSYVAGFCMPGARRVNIVPSRPPCPAELSLLLALAPRQPLLPCAHTYLCLRYTFAFQNIFLWRRFLLERQLMAATNGPDNVNERL